MSLLKRRERTREPPALWSERHPLASLHRQMDELFESFLGRMETPLPTWLEGGFPTVNVSETETAVRVTAELPGMDVEDVKVTLEDDALVLTGEKVDEKEEKDEERQWYRRERTSGAFRRVIPLPSNVDMDHVEATFDKGVLRVEMPRIVDESSRPRTVKVLKKE